MNTMTVQNSPEVGLDIHDGHATASSLDIAARFGKAHKNVLQSIERLGCSEEFRRLNFQPSSYINEQGRSQPMFNITFKGFAFLAMGFTGSAADKWKEAYIAAFDRMETELVERLKAENPLNAVAPSSMPYFGAKNDPTRAAFYLRTLETAYFGPAVAAKRHGISPESASRMLKFSKATVASWGNDPCWDLLRSDTAKIASAH